MSSKKIAWTDHLVAESDLPSDDFTWTEGSNYGLDGFSFDQTLGEGLNHQAPAGSRFFEPAQTSGMSELPDGFISKESNGEFDNDWGTIDLHDEQDGLNLDSMLSEDEGALPMSAKTKQAASLVDLSWLDPTQEQDPARLPKELRPDQPPLNSSLELEEAWGVNRRTDGLNLVPNRDKAILDYEQAIESGLPATPGVEKNAGDAAWHIKKAVRMSHYGETMDTIVNYLHANLDEVTASRVQGVIAADHGVAGRVFVRASAFPGLKNGKWVQELRRIARTARYVITDNPLIATKLGMEMVSEVPWKRALAHYSPLLKAAGHRVASVGGDAKKTLQLAFLTGPKAASFAHTAKPVDVRPADTVSVASAKKALAAAPKPVQVVVSKDDTAEGRKAALVYVAKAVKAGFIAHADALKLGQSIASPASIREAASQLIRANQAATSTAYQGDGTRFFAKQAEARDEAWASLRQAELTAHALRKAHLQIAKMVEVGLLREKEARFALQQTTAAQILKVATTIIQAADFHRKSEVKPTKVQGFKGPVYHQAEVVETEKARRQRDAAWVALKEAELVAREMEKAQGHVLKMIEAGLLTKKEALHAQQQPTAAEVMKIASALVQAAPQHRKPDMKAAKVRNFQGQVFTEAQPQARTASVRLAEVQKLSTWLQRQMSEGMVGKDLTALLNIRFAAPLRTEAANLIAALRQEHEGLSGHLYVDAAAYASKTGTNGCEVSAATHRANNIPYVKAMDRCAGCVFANANNVCTKYGKQLLTKLPKNAAEFQQRMIRQADAPDQEVTAALFNPQEFSLGNALEVEMDEPEVTENIGDVMFDGLHL